MDVSKLVLTIFVSFFISGTSKAQGSWNLSYRGSYKLGNTKAVTSDSTTLYYSRGTELEVAYIGDPENPVYLTTLPTSGIVNDLMLVQEYLYVLNDFPGLRVYDITSPSDPNLVASIAIPEVPQKIIRNDQVAYLTTHSGSLVIMDINDPGQPVIQSFVDLDVSLDGLIILQDHLYISSDSGVKVLNLNVPAQPVYITEILPHLRGMSLAGRDSILHIATDSLYNYWIADPQNSILLSVIDLSPSEYDRAARVERVNNSLYVSIGPYILKLSVADPVQTEFSSVYQDDMVMWISEFALMDDHVYAAGYWINPHPHAPPPYHNLMIIDVSSDTMNRVGLVWEEDSPWFSHPFTVQEDIIFYTTPVYTAPRENVEELICLNISNPEFVENILVPDTIAPYLFGDMVFAHGSQYLWTVGYDGEIQGLNVSDPHQIELAGRVDIMNSPSNNRNLFAFEENIVVGGNLPGWNGLGHISVIDVSNPYAPNLVSELNFGFSFDGLTHHESTLGILETHGDSTWFHQVDLRIPELVSSFELPNIGWSETLGMNADYAFFAHEEGNMLYIQSLHNESDFRIHYFDPSYPDADCEIIGVSEHYLYLGFRNSEWESCSKKLVFTDISIENGLQVLGSYDLPEGIWWHDNAVDDDQVIIHSGGMFSFFQNENVVGTEPPGRTYVSPLLVQSYPNPFNPNATIKYDFPELSVVNLTIYDVTGREVVTLIDQKQPGGNYELQWNGLDGFGKQVSTGIYLARFQAGEYSKTIKMVLLR